MGKSDALENQILNYLFNNTAIPNLPGLTDFFVALHTADPTDAGDQTASEATYTGYARVAVNRTGTGWTVSSSGSVSPQADIDFPTATAGSETITHWSVGQLVSGAGEIYYHGTVTPNIAVSASVSPKLTTASTVTED